MKTAVIGLGEAGTIFARAMCDAGWQVTGYDILPERTEAAGGIGVSPAASHAEAAAGAAIVLSTVTADQSEAAAKATAPGLGPGQVYIDLNSVAPAVKQAAMRPVMRRGAEFVEAVAMDTVPRCGAGVPILACGPRAASVADTLGRAGFRIEYLGPSFGTASAAKLTRSIFVKGLEALLADVVRMGERVGQTDRVLASIEATFPGIDWRALAGYHLTRMVQHGARRAAEMQGCARMMDEAGLDSGLVAAIAERHAEIARDVPDYDGERVEDFARAVRAAKR